MARSRTQSKTTADTKTAPAKALATPKAKAATKAKSNGSTTAAAAKPRRTRPSKSAPAAISHEQIAAKAYEIWEAKGRPLGMDEQNWQEAEAALTAR